MPQHDPTVTNEVVSTETFNESDCTWAEYWEDQVSRYREIALDDQRF